jgi:hypothetical protein
MSNRKKKTHPDGYWSKEKVVEESKKYNILDDFNKSSKTAAGLAHKNGWLDEMTWLSSRKKGRNSKRIHIGILFLAEFYQQSWHPLLTFYQQLEHLLLTFYQQSKVTFC